MWNKQSDVPSASPSQQSTWQSSQSASSMGTHPSSPASHAISCLGATVKITGQVTGEEDLQIDGKVEGSVVLNGQRLIVGRSGKLSSEVWAREVAVYGSVIGNVHASDRVEIMKDGSVTGDIITARISVEDGAYFKGHIEIERAKHAKLEADFAELAGATN